MVICTIGFSKKNLREFINRIQNAGVEKVIDVRLNNTSQLAGYSKKQDLEYVLELVGIDYEHRPEFAPTDELMKDYKDKRISWDDFKDIYDKILAERKPLNSLALDKNGVICLLCAEDKPAGCHRSLAAEYIKDHLKGAEIKHL